MNEYPTPTDHSIGGKIPYLPLDNIADVKIIDNATNGIATIPESNAAPPIPVDIIEPKPNANRPNVNILNPAPNIQSKDGYLSYLPTDRIKLDNVIAKANAGNNTTDKSIFFITCGLDKSCPFNAFNNKYAAAPIIAEIANH